VRIIAVLTAVLALAFPAAGSAHFLPHKKHLTLTEKVAYFQRSVSHDRAQVVRDQHRLRLLRLARYEQIVGARPLYQLISGRAHWHRVAFRWHRALLARYTRKLEAQAPQPGWWLEQAACIRSHEGAWTSATGNGYYGAYQFLLSTWQRVGGQGYPHQASPAEQTYRAWLVWRQDGGSWREWGTAGMCGLA